MLCTQLPWFPYFLCVVVFDSEKSMKSKSRLKFEQFLDEQHERNERNKTIIQMLESIDEQAATLATKSERLKIMKVNNS